MCDARPVFDAKAQDTDQIVAILCSRFAVLFERVKSSEERRETWQREATSLQSELRDAEAERRAALHELQASLRTLRSEAERARKQREEANRWAAQVQSELRLQSHAAAAASSQRFEDDSRFAKETEGLCLMSQDSECERESLRLRSVCQAASADVASLELQVNAGRAREGPRRAELRVLEERAAESGAGRHAAERRAHAHHGDVCSTLQQIALLSERFDGLSLSHHRSLEELQQEDERLRHVATAAEQSRKEVSVMRGRLARRKEIEASMESAHSERARLQSLLQAAEQKRSAAVPELAKLDARLLEVQASSAAVEEKHASAEVDHGCLRQRLEAMLATMKQMRAELAKLELEQEGGSRCAASLQAELQHLYGDTQKLRLERDEVASTVAELQQRLRVAEVALDAARSRSSELAEKLEDLRAEVLRTRQRKENFAREVSHSREQMRSLRKRHSSLQEQATAMEKRLLRSSLGLGGAGGFAKAAAALADAKAVSTRTRSAQHRPQVQLQAACPDSECARQFLEPRTPPIQCRASEPVVSESSPNAHISDAQLDSAPTATWAEPTPNVPTFTGESSSPAATWRLPAPLPNVSTFTSGLPVWNFDEADGSSRYNRVTGE